MTLETTRAERLLLAGKDEAHFLFERLMRAYPHDWLPVAKYCRTLSSPFMRYGGSERWTRIVHVLERALREPDKDFSRADGFDPLEDLGDAGSALRHIRERDA